ncbi:MAG: hypothetical protein Q7T03_00550 [Deltaproteobacteria bacterium]|nr:hypothetical protein [Deltaproteobacteria bacterium]
MQLSLNIFLKALWRYRSHCLLITLFLTTTIMSWFLSRPDSYVAQATIMNADSGNTSSAASLNQLIGMPNSNEDFLKFIAILNSRTFKEQLVDSLGTAFFSIPQKRGKLSEEALKNTAVGILSQAIRLRLEPDATNVLKVIVTMNRPELPAVVANQTLVELQKYIQNNSLTKSKRLRNFVESSIMETKAAIFENAKLLADFYHRYPVNPAKGVVENPFQKELEALSAKQEENAVGGALATKKELLLKKLEALQEIPEQTYFGYLQDESQILKEINVTLRQQYELAKLEEVKEEPFFQVLDKAIGTQRATPSWSFYAGLSLAFSLLLSCGYVLFRLFYLPSSKRIGFAIKERLGLRTIS